MRKSKEKRLQQIRQILSETDSMPVRDLAEKLSVTPETIRSDLDLLEEQGLIERSHGFARALKTTVEIPFEVRKTDNYELKKAIATEAIRRIENGSTVFLDSGTTVYCGLEMLKSKKDLTIITNTLPIADACLDMNFDVVFVGGKLSRKGKRADGYFTEMILDQLHIDLAILASDGVLNLGGISVYSPHEYGTKRKVKERSDILIGLIDSTKFDRRGTYKVLDFSDLDLIITNPLTEEQRAQVQGQTEIYEVPEN